MKRNIAILLAAGSGVRAEFSTPKQLVKLCGRTLLDHTLDRFEDCDLIHEIAIVTSKDCIDSIENIVARRPAGKVKKILLGGNERYESSLAAIKAYEMDSDTEDIRLVFHDAVRPLVSNRIISDVIAALDTYNAVDVTVPATDTIVVADPDTGTMREIPDRRVMHLGQTPQAFSFAVIQAAYELALKDPLFRTTDDCGVVLKYLPDERIILVPGSPTNLKLTYPDDLLVLDKFMQGSAARRLNAVSDAVILASLRGKSIVIFGGTSGIGESMARLAKAFGAKVSVASRSTGVDISDVESVACFLAKIAEENGGIDAIVNTAAVLNRQPLANMSTAEVTECINTNLLGALNVARMGYDYLKATRGHLMFFTSSSYTYGRSYYSTYSATKAAVVNLSQALADEWGDAGIRVNCVSPERTRTPMRVKAFGKESPQELMDPDIVARKSLSVLATTTTGFVFDINRL